MNSTFKTRLSRYAYFGIILGLLSVLVFPSAASAQQAGQGLEISPPLIDRQFKAGEQTSINIRIRNVTKQRVIAVSRVDDFVAQGEDGQPRILTDENAEPTPYSIKTWVAPISDLDLAPGEAKTADIKISVPTNASPGAHFGVIRFTAVSPDGQEGVALSASIGSLVLANIPGDAKTTAGIEQFSSSQNGKQRSLFEYGPVTITERIKNTGNIFVKPNGEVKVKNIFGREVASLKVNEKNGNILPGSIRKFEQTLDKKYLFGRYTANLMLLYGESNQQLSGQISFWVIPYKLILLALLIIIVLIMFMQLSGKKYKKRLMKQIQKDQKK